MRADRLTEDVADCFKEHARMAKALRDIKGWCESILNADRGEVGYELREFAAEVYGECCNALPSVSLLETT